MRDRILLGLVLFSFVIVGLFAPAYGFQAFLWDDSEYVLQGLQTADSLYQQSLFAWPHLIWSEQHYGKPPLYPNTLAAAITIFGHNHVPLAVGVLAVVSSVLLAWAVYCFVRPYASLPRTVLAILAVAGMGSVAHWAPMAYPEIQLSVCVLWALLLLRDGGGWWWLGIALGFGMLAKTTYPSFVLLPVAFGWWLSKERGRYTLRMLAAGFLGLAIAAIWYLPNWRIALAHANHGYLWGGNRDIVANITAWSNVLPVDGMGFVLLAGFAAALLWLVPAIRHGRAQFATSPLVWLVISALPFLLTSLTSSNVTVRIPMPSLVLLTIAGVLVVYWIADTAPGGRVALACFSVAVIVQWSLSSLAQIPRTGEWLRGMRAAPILQVLIPPLAWLRGTPEPDVDWVMNFAPTLGPSAPGTWYFSGDQSRISVPRLALAAYLRGLPLQFSNAEYFDWPEDEIRRRLDEIAREPSLLLMAQKTSWTPADVSPYRNHAMAVAALNRFHPLASNGTATVYASQLGWEQLGAASRFPENTAVGERRFGDIEVLAHRLDGCVLTLKLRRIHPVSCSIGLFVHAFDVTGGMSIWDQSLSPPPCDWQDGSTRFMSFALPDHCRADVDHIDAGFFDTADPAHGWPPLRSADGSTSMRLLP